MSSIALKDNQIVYAKNLNFNDKNTIFNCPTKGCKAKLRLCAIDSNLVSPYFTSININEHIDYCYIPNCNSDTNPTTYNKDSINLNNILNGILNNNNNPNNQHNINHNGLQNLEQRPIRSLKTAYFILKQIPINEYVNQMLVKDIILDNRTDYYYKNGIYKGVKIVEAKINKFKDLKIYISPILNDNIIMTLNFNCKDTFKYILNNLKKDENNKILSPIKNNFIVIIGEWHNNKCIINKKNQIIFI